MFLNFFNFLAFLRIQPVVQGKNTVFLQWATLLSETKADLRSSGALTQACSLFIPPGGGKCACPPSEVRLKNSADFCSVLLLSQKRKREEGQLSDAGQSCGSFWAGAGAQQLLLGQATRWTRGSKRVSRWRPCTQNVQIENIGLQDTRMPAAAEPSAGPSMCWESSARHHRNSKEQGTDVSRRVTALRSTDLAL